MPLPSAMWAYLHAQVSPVSFTTSSLFSVRLTHLSFDNTRINCTQKCLKRVEPCGHPCMAMCCDPCKCQVCDRYSNGMKAMLRPAPANGGSSFKPNPQNTTFRAPPLPPAGSSMNSEGSGSTTEQWKAYANGGARADDVQVLQKQQEEDAKFYDTVSNVGQSAAPASARLIEFSPKKGTKPKAHASNNIDLLLDLDIGSTVDASSQPKQRINYKETFSYAAAAKSKADKTNFNLLD